MPHYYGSSTIDTRDFPREGRQGIDSSFPHEVGQVFNVRLNLMSKVGSAISLFFNGKRYGSARVIAEPCKDEKYHVAMQRCGGMNETNMADKIYTVEVEHSTYTPDQKDYWSDPYA